MSAKRKNSLLNLTKSQHLVNESIKSVCIGLNDPSVTAVASASGSVGKSNCNVVFVDLTDCQNETEQPRYVIEGRKIVDINHLANHTFI